MTYNSLPVVQFLIVNFTKGLIKRRSQARNLQQRTFIRVVYEVTLSGKQQLFTATWVQSRRPLQPRFFIDIFRRQKAENETLVLILDLLLCFRTTRCKWCGNITWRSRYQQPVSYLITGQCEDRDRYTWCKEMHSPDEVRVIRKRIRL